MVAIDVPASYGYCVLVAVASQFVLVWMGINVGKMRKKFGIKYPTMYSTDKAIFNCYQRAHQNTLENYSQFLMGLLLGGLYCPVCAAASGGLWLVSRVVYALGYYTGDPANRNRGAFGYIGLIGLLYCSIRQGAAMLGWF